MQLSLYQYFLLSSFAHVVENVGFENVDNAGYGGYGVCVQSPHLYISCSDHNDG